MRLFIICAALALAFGAVSAFLAEPPMKNCKLMVFGYRGVYCDNR